MRVSFDCVESHVDGGSGDIGSCACGGSDADDDATADDDDDAEEEDDTDADTEDEASADVDDAATDDAEDAMEPASMKTVCDLGAGGCVGGASDDMLTSESDATT